MITKLDHEVLWGLTLIFDVRCHAGLSRSRKSEKNNKINIVYFIYIILLISSLFQNQREKITIFAQSRRKHITISHMHNVTRLIDLANWLPMTSKRSHAALCMIPLSPWSAFSNHILDIGIKNYGQNITNLTSACFFTLHMHFSKRENHSEIEIYVATKW